jgi:hypothetical protein
MVNQNTPTEQAETGHIETGHAARPPRTPWVLLLPLALFAGTLWQKSQPPGTPLGNMDMSGSTARNATDNSVTPRPTPTHRSGAPDPNTAVELILYVPDDNAELQRQVITDPTLSMGEMPTAPSRADSVTATRAVSALFEKARDVFPSGTKLVKAVTVPDASEEKNVIRVDLNRNFPGHTALEQRR